MPEEYRDRSVTLEFEGVYRDAMVFINGEFAAQRPNGYTNFYVKADPYLRYGEPNTIRVQARAHQDSRWYTGAGIYRDTKLIVGELVHVALDGVRVTTPDVDAERAVVAIATTVENETRATRTVRVTTRIRDAGRRGGRERVGAGHAAARARAEVARDAALRPLPSAVERGRARTSTRAETTVTRRRPRARRGAHGFGIRTLQLDPQHGLRINGETVNLRGACIHHDNGLLGAAAIARAEERRVEILKAAGFNAIRSAHNPISKAAARRLRPARHARDGRDLRHVDRGRRAPFDYSLDFPEWWERDVEAMVAKDFNHPSVDHVLDRQRDPRDRPPDRLDLGPQARREGPLARRHALRHQRHQPPASRSPDRHAASCWATLPRRSATSTR